MCNSVKNKVEIILSMWLTYVLITWRNSARAEILARLAGLNFQPGFWNKSSKIQTGDYMEKDSTGSATQPGLKILARFEKPG